MSERCNRERATSAEPGWCGATIMRCGLGSWWMKGRTTVAFHIVALSGPI